MRKIDNLRQFLPVVIFSTIMFASTVEVNAQNHRKDGKNESERKEYRESNHRDDHRDYNDRNDDRKSNCEQKNRNHYECDRDHHPKYSHNKHDYYEHHRYGRVYHRFDHNPVVFHHDRDDYYYYGNHFYNYRQGVGYYVVEAPRKVYFSQLPDGCERVCVNGSVFFKNADLYFQLSPRGYALVNSPKVSISATF